MAEASCSGPSPFKRLVDHQSRDVSHHQDRLVDRAGVNGHASFRSSPQHPAQQGHDSFGAFLNGGPSAPPAGAMIPGMPHSPAGRLNAHAAALQQPMPQHMQHEFAQQQHQARASPAPDLTSWAADFSRFTAGNNQQQHQQPQMRGGAAPMQMQMAQPNFQGAFGQAFSPMFGQQGPQFMQPGAAAAAAAPVAESDFDQEMARWMASNGGGNMTDVDAAMEQMARELELNEAALPQTSSEATEAVASQQQTSTMTDLETPELGNLSLNDHTTTINAETIAPTVEDTLLDQPQQHQPPEDAAKGKSAVSEAAERLLESVQHEAGEKWQNSVFLSLMRDFRDGRKDIVDNEIRQMEGEGDGSGGGGGDDAQQQQQQQSAT
ncbi:hypothetical protein VFPFJ_04089 [Purpureocillium lilacinum]|uniref:Peroxin 20 n=1 Tax=Purpureocillium lilacinum TaxID=33203 RepID=A0A179HSE5_PURLI|nr:hypothetical protein VFPFJ_04089 [Purpureocillium lilacinum]OAQ92349.1 hypothetical protein VFPFJ_04089 [Purpureocillium lilacinum]GJN73624.1 hypothetical protein PLICBS_007706 [Purpureocillium lilacinum]